MALHNIKFPGKKTFKSSSGTLTFSYDSNFTKNFNDNMNKIQMFLDNEIGKHLQKYVSFRYGDQEGSIAKANTFGKGYVMINVPYAEYQAYSKRITKRVGKRGTQPFERMKTDKSASILKSVQDYSRRING